MTSYLQHRSPGPVSAAPASAITTVAVDVLDGVPIDYVSIPDISDTDQPGRATVQGEISAVEAALRAHPEFAAPETERVGDELVLRANNPVADRMYASRPALRSWRTRLVPTAKALTPVYLPYSPTLPTGEPIDPATRGIFLHSLDGIGIRTRAAVMSAVAARYVRATGMTRWASLACGAAIPVFQALNPRLSGALDVKLVDLDPEALGHAAEYATSCGFLEGVDFQLIRAHLIEELIVSTRLVGLLGESSMDFVDMLGIFEYIPETFNGMRSAATFLHNAFRLVRPGGGLVFANILDTHPRLMFNQRGLGWPGILPRTREGLLRIVSDAGIALDQVSMTIPDDGMFAVVEVRKPMR